LPNEAFVIMGIPLSIRNTIDRVVWAYTPMGVFSTSSTYKLLIASTTTGSSNQQPVGLHV